ncbi:MAG: hypothetical protein K9L78_00705 [Victivallales bacterium]|nr:hypothetical protein [Victivallales bacterium]MCF7888616.1 hypothetical protein [Victivallales bacterium]
MVKSNNNNECRTGIFGLGLDSKDGHTRITKGENYYLYGGSEETHEKMAETTAKFNEKLTRRGKKLEELSKNEFNDMMHDAFE